jgi:allantoin racemase
VAASGAQLASDPQWALEVLAQACEQAASRFAPQAIIIGGAGLAGMAALLQARCPLPLIDSVVAGAQRAWALAQPSSSAAQPSPAMGFDVAWQGLSGAMHGLVKPIQA